MANFGDYLNKYGVRWTEKRIQRSIYWHNRRGRKLSGIIAHTEGAVKNIPGTADRSLYSWFNNPQSSYTNAYITFSGFLELYLRIEDGSIGTGDAEVNAATFQIETQDNGRYNDPKTYTNDQYRAWAGTYCALVEYSNFHKDKATPIRFDRSARGIRGHNEINKGRACPGKLDLNRIIREAQALWDKTNNPPVNDGYYRVIKQGKQLNAYKIKRNAVNYFIDNNADKVTYNNLDVTADFMATKNKLETELEDYKTRVVPSLEKNLADAKEAEAKALERYEAEHKSRLAIEKSLKACNTKVDALEQAQEEQTILNVIRKVYERFFRKNN